MMNSVNMEKDQWQMGLTKVFIKAPESVRIGDVRAVFGYSRDICNACTIYF